MQSAWFAHEEPTRLTGEGVVHLPLVHSSPGAHAVQRAPPAPQLMTLVRLRGTQALLGSRQPSHVTPPPPPVFVLAQLKVVGLQVDALAKQSTQLLPAEPQVVLFALLGGLTQVPRESQHPSQFDGLQMAAPPPPPVEPPPPPPVEPPPVPPPVGVELVKQVPKRQV